MVSPIFGEPLLKIIYENVYEYYFDLDSDFDENMFICFSEY